MLIKKPLGKVSVQVKGTSRTTSTDEAGKFSIPATGADVLIFTSVGYVPQEIHVGNQESVNVSMGLDGRNMESVVVTALGIKREARKLS